MMRDLTGKDKLEILRRCAAEPFSAAQLAASMNLNSGTVSRNVYGLYKLGYLETRGDGERVNYITPARCARTPVPLGTGIRQRTEVRYGPFGT